MKTHSFDTILVPDAVLDLDTVDNIDTGDIDGSGEITVRAVDVAQANRGVEFYQVTIDCEGDYESWTEADILAEAVSMLERDYCERE